MLLNILIIHSLSDLYFFFSIMLVVGLFLTAGTHPPTGGLFSFFGRHVPFFSLFRSPWYIFAPLVGLSIAGLVGLFVDRIEEVIPKKTIVYVFSSLFIVGTLIYAYPLILGKIFRPNFNGTFYIRFPQYVFDVSNYLAHEGSDGRILSYPDDNIEKFSWGYSGVDSILNLFSDREVVFSPLNDTGTSISQAIAAIYDSIKKQEIVKANSLANTLGIDQIFEKKDQVSLAPQLPSTIANHKIASFNQWNFYQFPIAHSSAKIFSVNSLVLNYSSSDASGNLSLLQNGQILVSPIDSVLDKFNSINNFGSVVQSKNSIKEELDASQVNPFDLNTRMAKHSLDSVEYDFNIGSSGEYQPILENHELSFFGIVRQNSVDATLDGSNIILNIEHTDDSYIYFSFLFLTIGSHKLIIAQIGSAHV